MGLVYIAAQGYILRKQLPTNKKNVYVYLSAQGRALRKKLVPLAEDTNSISTRGISPDELLTTRRVLLKMIENLADDELDWEAGVQRKPVRLKRTEA
jgi:DNA-binding MarR family transcriptional regulator